MKALVVIPARGGSKGLPGKNIKLLHGKPLIHYTIDAARQVFDDADILVSTDAEEIKNIAEETGLKVPFLRPANLATDGASSQEVLMHALNVYEENNERPDYVVLLQVTSPLRTGTHLKEALALIQPQMDMLVSVKETDVNPYYVLYEEDTEGYLMKTKKGNFTRRQDCPKVWELNGAIYIINTQSLLTKPMQMFDKLIKYPMTKSSSLDIDDQIDFDLVHLIMKKNGSDH